MTWAWGGLGVGVGTAWDERGHGRGVGVAWDGMGVGWYGRGRRMGVGWAHAPSSPIASLALAAAATNLPRFLLTFGGPSVSGTSAA